MSTEFFKPEDFEGEMTFKTSGRSYYNAKEVANFANRLLIERGTMVVHGRTDRPEWPWTLAPTIGDTHSALLINITPLKQESPERALLREFVDLVVPEFCDDKIKSAYDRAKKLLEGE